jgi:hypothetical protein
MPVASGWRASRERAPSDRTQPDDDFPMRGVCLFVVLSWIEVSQAPSADRGVQRSLHAAVR